MVSVTEMSPDLISPEILERRKSTLYDTVLRSLSDISSDFGYQAKVKEYRRIEKPHYQVDLRRGISHAEFAIQTLKIIEDEVCRDNILKELENEEASESVVLSVLADEIRLTPLTADVVFEKEKINTPKPLLTAKILQAIKEQEIKKELDGVDLDTSQKKSRMGHASAFGDGYDLVIHIVDRSENMLALQKQSIIYADA